MSHDGIGGALEAGDGKVETIFDWVCVAIFGAMVVLFLHRSTSDEAPKDNIYQYMPAAFGCAVANYFGNHEQTQLGAAIVIGVVVYIVIVLKPFNLKLWG